MLHQKCRSAVRIIAKIALPVKQRHRRSANAAANKKENITEKIAGR
jgi:hypothetical protein